MILVKPEEKDEDEDESSDAELEPALELDDDDDDSDEDDDEDGVIECSLSGQSDISMGSSEEESARCETLSSPLWRRGSRRVLLP